MENDLTGWSRRSGGLLLMQFGFGEDHIAG